MSSRKRALLIGLLLTLGAAGLCARATLHGVGASRDSVSYIHYARILLFREPLRTPTEGVAVSVTHYPPLYPVVLAALGYMKMTLLNAARVVNLVTYGLLAGLAYGFSRRRGATDARAIAVAVMVLIQPSIAFMHLWAVSEPIFLVTTLVLLGLLTDYAAGRGRGIWMALGIGSVIAIGSLDRYIGPAYLPAAMWVVWRTRNRTGRWRDMAIVVGTALLPVVLLAIGQRVFIGNVGHRSIEYHALTSDRFVSVLAVLQKWLADTRQLSDTIAWILASVLLIALLTLVARFGRRSGFAEPVLALTVSYSVLLLVSVMFVDNGTPLDERLLCPIGLMWVVWIMNDLPSPFAGIDPQTEPKTPIRTRIHWSGPGLGAAVAVLIVAAGNWDATNHNVAKSMTVGMGFSHRMYRISPLIRLCKTLPKDAVIFSNFPEPIWLHAGREASILPGHPTKTLGREKQESLESLLDGVRRHLRGGGYVAYLDFEPGRGATMIPVSIDELKAAIPLKLVERVKDGVLLQSRDRRDAVWTPSTRPLPPATMPAQKDRHRPAKRAAKPTAEQQDS